MLGLTASLTFVLAAILVAVHWFSEQFAAHVERFHAQLVSFSAGLFIAFIFLVLLPELVEGASLMGEKVFVFLLAGFVLFHVMEKYIYQHVKNKDVLLRELAEVHAAGFFIDHFVVGAALFFAINSPQIELGFLLFIPLFLHTISSGISLTHIDEHFQNRIISITLAASPLIGALFAFLLNPARHIFLAIFAFVVGALLYVVIRDMLPEGSKGNPLFFVLGLILSLAMFMAAGIVGW